MSFYKNVSQDRGERYINKPWEQRGDNRWSMFHWQNTSVKMTGYHWVISFLRLISCFFLFFCCISNSPCLILKHPSCFNCPTCATTCFWFWESLLSASFLQVLHRAKFMFCWRTSACFVFLCFHAFESYKIPWI